MSHATATATRATDKFSPLSAIIVRRSDVSIIRRGWFCIGHRPERQRACPGSRHRFRIAPHDDANVANIGWFYQEADFQFLLEHTSFQPTFATFGTQESRFPGSTALFNRTNGSTTSIIYFGGGAFSIHSIDLANLNFAVPTAVTFVGTKTDLTTVTQTFAFTSFGALTTAVFGPEFTDLIRVHWTDGSLPPIQFDNVHLVARDALTSVPEPTSLLLLGAGLTTLATRQRRRTRH